MYVVEHGIDVPTLGLIAASWSIAKLIAEPIFGYLADRTSRRPFLVGGAIVLGIATMLPLVFTTAAALFVLRFISGAAAGAYDPAARGMIVDATEEGERGEAFGIYCRVPDGRLRARSGHRRVRGGTRRRLRVPVPAHRHPDHHRRRRARIHPAAARPRWSRSPDAVDAPVRDRPIASRPSEPPLQRLHGGHPRSGRGRPGSAGATQGPAQRQPGRGTRHELRLLARVRCLRGHLEPVHGRPRRVHRMDRPDVRPVRPADDARVALRRPPGGPLRTHPVRGRGWRRHLHRGCRVRHQHRAADAQRDGPGRGGRGGLPARPRSTLWLRSVHLPAVRRPRRVSSAPWAPSG